MGELVILYRPGILVLSGRITGIDCERKLVTIENYCSVVKETRTCIIHVQNNETNRPDMTIGSFILATVKSSQELATLATGGNDGTKTYVTSAYTIRYSGAYDFAPRGIEKEKHVFLGSVLSVFPGRNGFWYTVGWTKMSKRETRVLYADAGLGEKINTCLKSSNTSPLIFVTDGIKQSYNGSYYVIERICC